MNNFFLNVAYNKMNATKRNEKVQELSAVRRALNNLTDEKMQKRFVKGYWINNYKVGFDIMKPILGNHIRYAITHEARRILVKDLGIYQKQLEEQLNTMTVALKTEEEKWMRQNVNQQRNNNMMRQQLVQNNKASKIQKLMRTRFGKIYLPLEAIPLSLTKLARDKEINLNEYFEVTLKSATNPNLLFTQKFTNFTHFKNFIDKALANTSDNPNYGLNIFKINGVMDNVRISSLTEVRFLGGVQSMMRKSTTRFMRIIFISLM